MFRAVLFLTLLLLLLSSSVHARPIPPNPDSANDMAATWPLTRGSVWVYQGLVRWPQAPDVSPEVVEEPVTWTMEVLDVVTRGHVRAAVMRGHPADLLRDRPADARPSDYLLIQVDGGRFYEVRGEERPAQVEARLRDPADLLVDLVQDTDLVFDLPLVVGKHFCEAFQITRLDGGYCWVVDDEQPADLSVVAGIDPTRAYVEYQLHKGAVSGATVIGFVPGVGITSFFGVHFGVHWEAAFELVEFIPGEQ